MGSKPDLLVEPPFLWVKPPFLLLVTSPIWRIFTGESSFQSPPMANSPEIWAEVGRHAERSSRTLGGEVTVTFPGEKRMGISNMSNKWIIQ